MLVVRAIADTTELGTRWYQRCFTSPVCKAIIISIYVSRIFITIFETF